MKMLQQDRIFLFVIKELEAFRIQHDLYSYFNNFDIYFL
jgi:hypothetical protein